MRIYIYVTPNTPSESECRGLLGSLKPSISETHQNNIVLSFQVMKQRLRDAVINKQNSSHTHRQVFSLGSHRIILISTLKEPSKLRKLLDWINGFL